MLVETGSERIKRRERTISEQGEQQQEPESAATIQQSGLSDWRITASASVTGESRTCVVHDLVAVLTHSGRYRMNAKTEDSNVRRVMKIDDGRDQALCEVGGEILTALTTVAQAAQRALSDSPSGVSSGVLANPSNPMVGIGKAERHIEAISSASRENLRRLMREPFVARVEVDWGHEGEHGTQTIYFARPSAAGLMGAITDALLVTSKAPLGRLAEHEAGDVAVIEVNGSRREGYICKRSVFQPTQRDVLWDALIRKFEAMPWGDVLELLQYESMRQALEIIKQRQAGPIAEEDIVGQLIQEVATAELERLRIRRKVVDRIALRDQPILDKFQGEIFRLPLDRQVVLFGPPGSGKTTTLIKRLAQKRTAEGLTDAEQNIASSYIRENLSRQDTWAMFSPAELLKMYLSEAFNQEGVPDAGNVRTWEKERHDLARNVLRILKSNSFGRFQLEVNQNLLSDPSSHGISHLHDEVARFVETNLLRRCNDALGKLGASTDEDVRRAVVGLQHKFANSKEMELADVFRLFDQTEELQSIIKILTDEIAIELKEIINELLHSNTGLLGEIGALLPAIRAEEEDDEETEGAGDESELTITPANERAEALNTLLRALRNWARAIAEGRSNVGGRSGRLIELIKDKLPPESRLAAVGESIATASSLRTLVHAPRTFVLGVPAMYARFRRHALREGRHYISSETTTNYVNREKLSPDETDVLVLVMLRNARRIMQYPDGRRLESPSQTDWLENIRSRYLIQVFVDEATDLSAVQLACTVELTDPRLRSWFACGDLRQRITTNGIRDTGEFEWLNRTSEVQVDVREVNIGYRQSQKLRELGDALAALDGDGQVTTKAPRGDEEADVWPILGERLSGEMLGAWLAERIHEVEKGIGRLPSIAVFVDGDSLIDPLVKASESLLAERNIPIVGCKEGRVAGDAREVRVFDIQHIKGLEFEAVFFVGIDALARKMPDLFHRFFYVGVTRAATYLGVTCESTLPERLEAVRSHFRTDGWA